MTKFIYIQLKFYFLDKITPIKIYEKGNMMKKIILIILGMSIYLNANLDIKAEYIDSISTKNIGVMKFNIINNYEEFVSLKDIKINFGKGTSEFVKPLNNEEFKWWLLYAKRKNNSLLKNPIIQGITLGFSNIVGRYNKSNLKKAGHNNRDNSILNINALIPPGAEVEKYLVVKSKNHSEIGFIDKVFIVLNNESYKLKIRKKYFRKECDRSFKMSRVCDSEEIQTRALKNFKVKYNWQSDLVK
jgi:hypothetical protein